MEVTREVVLEAPLEEVWDALTDPAELAEWFANDVELELEPGGDGVFRWDDGEERHAVVEDCRSAATLCLHVGRRARLDRAPRGRRRHARPRHGDCRRGLERCSVAARPRLRARLSDVFNALGDPTRRHIVESLSRQEASATQLAAELPVTRQAVAKHLTALREAGLVDSRREGRETLYQLNSDPLEAAAAWIVRVGGEWDKRLARLERLVRSRRE